jgi:SAM-dependent methyltransferase
MKKLTFHPACLLFPKLPKADLLALAADIKANGLRNPIVLFQGQVLDGRNRLAACKIAKVKPRFVEWDGKGTPLQWVISENLIRRHLTSSQRAVIALDLLPLLEKEAKERQNKGYLGSYDPKSGGGEKGKSSQIAARLTKSNYAYVEAVKSISKSAPELIEKVRAGDLSIPDAKRLLDIPKEKRKELLQKVNGQSHNGEIFQQWRQEHTQKSLKPVSRGKADRQARIQATTLIHGDCRKELKKIASKSAEAIITDPIYPEVKRDYGRISEKDWHSLMHDVVAECHRVLKPQGSAIFILQPNYDTIGKMRLWLWRFLLTTAEEWNLIQDCYWWSVDAMPLAGTNRKQGLMRQSIKMCCWFGAPDCYRNQDGVLWTSSQANMARSRSDMALRTGPSGRTYRNGTMAKASEERGGVTPFNLLPIPTGGQPGGAAHHPAATPYDVAAWWCRYILPEGGTLLDPFCGSGTMLAAGLDHGAARVVGIDREKKYLAIAKHRIIKG